MKARTSTYARILVAVAICVIVAGYAGCVQQKPPTPTTPEPPAGTPSPTGWPKTFPNEAGPDVTLRDPAERVVCLQPNISEIMAAIGAVDAVIGVDRYTDYPPAMTEKPTVGDILKPDYEKIVSFRPDVIVTSRGTPMEVIDRLQDLGQTVLGIDPTSIDEVFEAMEMLGQMTGRAAGARKAVEDLRARRNRVQKAVQRALETSGRPSVVFILSFEPLFVAGKSSFVAQLIEQAGGEHVINVTDPSGQQRPWPQVSKETIISAAPDVLICGLAHGGERMGPEGVYRRLESDAAWAQLPAVENERVYTINDDIVSRPGPRLIQALEIIAEGLHPGIDLSSSDGGE